VNSSPILLGFGLWVIEGESILRMMIYPPTIDELYVDGFIIVNDIWMGIVFADIRKVVSMNGIWKVVVMVSIGIWKGASVVNDIRKGIVFADIRKGVGVNSNRKGAVVNGIRKGAVLGGIRKGAIIVNDIRKGIVLTDIRKGVGVNGIRKGAVMRVFLGWWIPSV
jgi:hypothetical protein